MQLLAKSLPQSITGKAVPEKQTMELMLRCTTWLVRCVSSTIEWVIGLGLQLSLNSVSDEVRRSSNDTCRYLGPKKTSTTPVPCHLLSVPYLSSSLPFVTQTRGHTASTPHIHTPSCNTYGTFFPVVRAMPPVLVVFTFRSISDEYPFLTSQPEM